MKVLLDSSVAGSAAAALTAAGHEVERVVDWIRDPGDEAILASAHSAGQVVITFDKDFGELAVVRRHPHAGIVRLAGFRAGEQGAAAGASREIRESVGRRRDRHGGSGPDQGATSRPIARTRGADRKHLLGAGRLRVLRLVAGRMTAVTAAGTAIGVVAAALAARWLGSMLFGVTPLDPVTFALVPLIFFGAAIVATVAPARRATRIDPIVALRGE